MKLYATTRTERASKGQGGNDYLAITVTDDKKEVIAELFIQNNSIRFWKDKNKLKDWNETKIPVCILCGEKVNADDECPNECIW